MQYIQIIDILLNLKPYTWPGKPNGQGMVDASSGAQKLVSALKEKDMNYKRLIEIIDEAEQAVKAEGSHNTLLKGQTYKQWFCDLREAAKSDFPMDSHL